MGKDIDTTKSVLERTIKKIAVTFADAVVAAFRNAPIAEVAEAVHPRTLSRMGRKRGQLTPRQEMLLFDDIPVPSNGVRTSDAAAEMLDGDSSRLRRLVFRVIERNRGMTCQEVEELTEIDHETISARIWELHTRGWLCDSGKTRMTRARRKAIVWIIGPRAKKNAKTKKKTVKRKGKT